MNLNISKKVFVAALCLLATGIQAQLKHEVSVYGGGGLSALDYKLHNINRDEVQLRPGGMAGIGYTLFLTEQWGITTGAEFTTYKSKAKLYSVMDSHRLVDDDNDAFDLVMQQKGHTEKQEATYVNIPLMVQFQQNEGTGFYAALGGKIGIPVKEKYKYSYNSLETKAFYPDMNVWYDDLEYRGIGQFAGGNGESDLDLKVSFMLSAETGMKWSLNNKMALYTGVYADYGLNDIVNGDKKENFLLYDNDNPTDFKNSSIFNSKYSYYRDNDRSLVGKVKPLAIGLKIRLSFSLQ